jgi:hypothetical protein
MMRNYTEKKDDINDVISMLDIWNVLKKHTLLFWVAFFVVFVTSAIFISKKASQYNYTQIIELPSYMENKTVVPVWPYGLVAEKITKFYLPAAEAKYNSVHKDKFVHLSNDSVEINNIGGALSLSLNGSLDAENVYKEMLQMVLESLRAETSSKLNEISDYLNEVLVKLQVQKKRIIGDIKLLNLEKNNAVVALLGNEYMSAVISVDERANDINYDLKSLRQASASDLVRSISPVGPSKMVLLVLFVFASLIISFFVVLITEFINGKNK